MKQTTNSLYRKWKNWKFDAICNGVKVRATVIAIRLKDFKLMFSDSVSVQVFPVKQSLVGITEPKLNQIARQYARSLKFSKCENCNKVRFKTTHKIESLKGLCHRCAMRILSEKWKSSEKQKRANLREKLKESQKKGMRYLARVYVYKPGKPTYLIEKGFITKPSKGDILKVVAKEKSAKLETYEVLATDQKPPRPSVKAKSKRPPK